jgi:hypothetical protein
MKYIKHVIALLVVIALALTVVLVTNKKPEAKRQTLSYDNLSLPTGVGTGKVAENDKFVMDWDSERACIILTNKITGEVWSTIPYDFYSTGETSGRSGIMMGSPLMLEYVSVKNKSAVETVNGFTGIFKNGSISSELTENGIKVYYCFDKLEIMIPIEYTLRETGISVSIIPTEIAEGKNLVYKVSPAPFLCNTLNSDNKNEQYIVVPSGSGALMYTDVRSDEKAREYSEAVYGEDPSVFKSEKFFNTATVRMPVFGAKDGNTAVCGIVEQGAGSAHIEALVGDNKIGWSSAYATFDLRGRSVSLVTYSKGATEVETVSEEITGYDKFSVGYYFLTEENANYSGMSNTYRQYLTENSGKGNDKISEKPLNLNVFNALSIRKLFLGVPYQDTVSATTFSETLQIIKDIEKLTDVPMDVTLVGSGETGVDIGKIAGGYGFSSAVGSKKDFSKLQEYCDKENIGLFADFDIVRFKDSGNGFSSTFDTAKTANLFTAHQYHYSVALRDQSIKYDRYVLLSRDLLSKAAEKVNKFAKKSNLKGIGLSTLGNLAYSDYDLANSIVRGNVENDTANILKNTAENGFSITLNQANAYAAILANKVTDVPVESSQYDILDTDVPLYQMVFKGVTDLSVAVNTASNPRLAFLRAVECGSGLEFTLSAQYETDFATTMHSAFSVSFASDNTALISEMIKESKDFYTAVQGAKITEHKMISEELHATEFDNGITVWVNYSDKAIKLPEGTVQPQGFMYREDAQ